MTRDALFYEKTTDGAVSCLLCPHQCHIAQGKSGICKARINSNGTLEAANYMRPVSMNIDPIEKKPLYHFLPSTDILSLGLSGCNMACPFCQNHSISQTFVANEQYTPENICSAAIKNGCRSIAYTYTEPSVWYETMLDTARCAHELGLKNVSVTNGMLNASPLENLLPYIDAMNIDLKTFNAETYKKIGGCLKTVKNTIENAIKHHVHIEITYLAITNFNCSEDEFENAAQYIASLSKDIPLHISRYFPSYKYNEPPTKLETLKNMFQIAKRHLRYVYIGNAEIENTTDTLCPQCGETLIKRRGYNVSVNINSPRCNSCGLDLPFIF